MFLLDFINDHPDWETVLAREPFCLKITHNGPYVLLKYQQFISDMSYALCQEARGVILRQVGRQWAPISIAMFKFFNAAEQYAATTKLDWTSAVITEKLDGSLMRLAFDHYSNEWLLSSNGTIYARDVTNSGYNFEDLFISILGGKQEYEKLLAYLDKDYCYFFEMVSRFNRICISYKEDGIYFLGRRNMITLKEDNVPLDFGAIKHPKQFQLYSLADCVAAANAFENDFEGFVVCDAFFNRIKIKTPWYLAMHKLRGNGVLTIKGVIEMWQKDTLDDFIAFYPEYSEFVRSITTQLARLTSISDLAYLTISRFEDIQSRGDFAAHAKAYAQCIRTFLFARLDGKCENAVDFFKGYNIRNLVAYIDPFVNNKSMGVQEDE